MTRFRDREDAGRQLAVKLQEYAGEAPVILGLPRGGVPVAYEVARALGAELDIWVVRKVGVPWHPELGMGAVAEGGHLYISRDVLDEIGVSDEELAKAVDKEKAEVDERIRRFRGAHPPPRLRDRTVILVDDGIATGGTVRAALRALRAEMPKQIVLAVPVASPDTLEALAPEVDKIVCLITPSALYAIGLWYEDFRQVPDQEVIRLLERHREERGTHKTGDAPHGS